MLQIAIQHTKKVWWWMKGVISNRYAISNLNSKYVYFQYKDTTYIQMLSFCIIYNAAQSLWNVMKWGISPGGHFPQPGTPSWCRTLATQQRIRHMNLKFVVKKIIVHPTPRWVPCTVSPQDSYDFIWNILRINHNYSTLDDPNTATTHLNNAITTCAKPRRGVVAK